VSGIKREYRAFIEAEELSQKIKSFALEPRTGVHGEFYILSSGIIPAEDDWM